MFARRIFPGLAASLIVAFSGVAVADYDRDYKRDFKREYRQCLKADPARFHGTIVDAALATPALGTLAFAVQAAGLVDVLNGPGPFTVFAPTNDAFAAVPEGILNTLLGDPAGLLAAVLTYHVIPGDGRRNDPRRTYWGWALERKTVQGQSVFFNRSKDGPQVNQSNVSCQAVKTDNGIVWIIDSVLLPQF